MLSIGKLSAPQANYYLDQAEARVDTVQSVGGGLEDYYTSSSEARGGWLGAGAADLGLSGAVDGDDLRAVLDGLGPRDGGRLRSSTNPVRVAGFDLTFSAPKSVSVVFGVGDDAVRSAVRDAHEVAVREAFGYMERSAAYVRRGAGGCELQPTDGLVAAAFRHRASRAGDPQLHTHVLVANLGRGTDGRWSTLDGRRIYAHARAASFIYQAVLRGELSARLGVEWTPVERGIAEIVGVPRPVLKAFSRRRAEIEAAMAERGVSGPHAAEAAALASRRPKDRRITAETLTLDWRARAQELGLDHIRLHELVGDRRAPRLDQHAIDRVLSDLIAADGLTRRRPTFSRRDVVQELCERLPAGARLDGRMLERLADELLASEQVVPLVAWEDDGGTESFRRRDGRRVPVLRGDLVYSTAAHLVVEQQLVDRIIAARGAGLGVAEAGAVATAMRTRPTLSDEQRAMVEQLCRGGDGVAVVAGKAGTGKTFALAAAREAWETSGQPVLGAAVARRAARALETGAGIPSTSVAALLRHASRRPLEKGCVLVVDEAGMLPTRQLAELLGHVQQAQGKLVLVGDHRQLPELEAGGAFVGLVRRGLAIELSENRRQTHAWERDALDHLRDGEVEQAVAAYATHGRIRVARTEDAARAQLVRDWWAAGDPDGTVMIAHRRADVKSLNAHARRVLLAAGRLGPVSLSLPAGDFAAGDRVVVKRNDSRLDLRNGERGTVLDVDADRGLLRLELDGLQVTLPASFLRGRTAAGDPTLVHGYAITGHVAQGLTVREAFVFGAEGLSGEWAYTAMSRGRERNVLYLAEESGAARDEFAPAQRNGRDAIERLTAELRTSAATPLAIDSGRPGRPGDAIDALLAERRAAERAHREAVTWRRTLEQRWTSRLPRGRERLDDARTVEAEEALRVAAVLERVEALSRRIEPTADGPALAARRALRERTVDRERDLGIER